MLMSLSILKGTYYIRRTYCKLSQVDMQIDTYI